MAAPLLILRDIGLGFGGSHALLDGAEFSVAERDRLCLVGRNGSGKSTLLKIAAGLVQPDRGERVLRQDVTMRYLPQEPDFAGYDSTLAYVEAGLAPGDAEHRARYLLNELGLGGDENPARLSGGEARLAALARVLAPRPDILLLDEPTNHLDLPAIEWLEAELRGMDSALVLISHDRRFLSNLSRRTVWLDRGQTRTLERGFGEFEAWRDEMLEQEEVERHKLDRKIAAELDWLRYGVTARRKRNMGRLRGLQDLRRERRDQRRAVGDVKLNAAEAEASAKLVAELENVGKSYGERVIVRDLNLRLRRGDRLGIVGPNGAGKTTLINLLTGGLAPDSGKAKLGQNLAMVTLDQRREALDPQTTLQDTLTQGRGDMVHVGDKPRHVIGYMKDFLFSPEQARTPVGRLSGGERGRLMLARAMAAPSNLLVLDEPTNDLDLETLDLLQEMLGEYPGTVLLVSHDRDFLDRVVTHVLAYEGDGRWQLYAGGYSDMLAQRGPGIAVKQSASAKPERKAENAAAPSASNAKRRLSFKDKHALETLPKRMAALQADIAKQQAKLDDPALFGRDPAAFNKTAEALAKAQAELAEAEDEWLRLEMLREDMEAQ